MSRPVPHVTIDGRLVTFDLTDRACYQAVVAFMEEQGYFVDWSNHPGGEPQLAKELRQALHRYRYLWVIVAYDGTHNVSCHGEGGGEVQYIHHNLGLGEIMQSYVAHPPAPGIWVAEGQLNIRSWRSYEGDYDEDYDAQVTYRPATRVEVKDILGWPEFGSWREATDEVEGFDDTTMDAAVREQWAGQPEA